MIWGDDIGWQNVSAYGLGTMGYMTPNIDSIGLEGIRFTDHYAQPSCTAGRASFITGQYPIRSGMVTVGQPGDPLGLQPASPCLAEVMKGAGRSSAAKKEQATAAIVTKPAPLCQPLKIQNRQATRMPTTTALAWKASSA